MNEASQQRSNLGARWLRVIINLILCLVILAGVAFAIMWINRTEPVAKKVKSMRKSAALVETLTVNYGTYSPELVVLGTVRPAQQITLQPRVSGQVLEVAPSFVPGGMISQGELLLRIDPSDFENALSIQKSQLEQATASMAVSYTHLTLPTKA